MPSTTKDQRGFVNYERAANLTAQMARGLATPYWLVQDRGGLYHFVKIAQKGVNVEGGAGRETLAFVRQAQLSTLRYLGVMVVEEYDHTGRKVG